MSIFLRNDDSTDLCEHLKVFSLVVILHVQFSFLKKNVERWTGFHVQVYQLLPHD